MSTGPTVTVAGLLGTPAPARTPPPGKVEITAEWVGKPPRSPCELLPLGGCGLLLVVETRAEHSRKQDSTTYGVAILGRYWKRKKHLEVLGFRLISPGDGKVYDVDPNGAGGPTCSCMSFLAHPNRRLGCRHIHGLRLAGVPEIPMLDAAESNTEVNTFDGTGIDNPT